MHLRVNASPRNVAQSPGLDGDKTGGLPRSFVRFGICSKSLLSELGNRNSEQLYLAVCQPIIDREQRKLKTAGHPNLVKDIG